MHILIIEDEKPAAAQLSRLLLREMPSAEISGPLVSVQESTNWFASNPQPDLIFLDIHLADGPSFDIFKDAQLTAPIVFCTAFDQYALDAFKLNSIDYLLKPVEPEELKRALAKFEAQHKQQPPISKELLINLLDKTEKQYKTRFVVKVGTRLLAIETSKIDFFYSAEKASFLQTNDGKSYVLEHSLDKLESLVDPAKFFRINRQYLIRYEAIEEVRSYSASRYKITLRHCADGDVLISRDRTSSFKEWLDG
jgi:DNA-binding LytR/AlgR family response regulator